ncbi:hypothetical protein BpHYR1_020765, partial [Brachionus plicatilis]
VQISMQIDNILFSNNELLRKVVFLSSVHLVEFLKINILKVFSTNPTKVKRLNTTDRIDKKQ